MMSKNERQAKEDKFWRWTNRVAAKSVSGSGDIAAISMLLELLTDEQLNRALSAINAVGEGDESS
jgi:hypothetical protein